VLALVRSKLNETQCQGKLCRSCNGVAAGKSMFAQPYPPQPALLLLLFYCVYCLLMFLAMVCSCKFVVP
jgi:hypothetical protein